MSEPSEDPPKIIVDDDWKSQVEKEKREAAQAATASPPPAATQNDAASSAEDAGGVQANAAQESGAQESGAEASGGAQASGVENFQTPPPATFEMLVTMLFTQAMASLGQLPGPDGKMGPVNKEFAKYFIDSVELLGEKTKGNLSDDESKMISEALHAMRMAFVSVKAK